MLSYFLILSLIIPGGFPQTPNCGCEDKPQINVLAVVNGVKITRQDLNIDTKTQVSLVQGTVIAARNQALSFLINKALLEAEAKKRGLTSTQLLELEVSAKIVPPTEAEARVFYEQNRDRASQSFSKVKTEIIARLRTEREKARESQFANVLRAGAQIAVSNQQVTPPTNEVQLARVFANVNGANITSRDIEESLLPLIFRVQQQVYAIRKRDLDIRINDLLLEQEAKRLGTTPKALIDQNVRTKLPIINEQQAKAFYKEQKSKLKGDFSEVKIQLMQYLQRQEEQKLLAAYADELRRGAALQIYLTEPQSANLRQLCCNPVD